MSKPAGEEKEEQAETRTAIVTGASSGLGVAIACALGELGWRVAIGARRKDRLDETAKQVEAAGGKCLAHFLDVGDPDSVEEFFAASERTFGTANVIVNNAGLSHPGALHELRIEDIQREVATNLLGPTFITRRALPPMLERGQGGDIIFISSDAARNARPRQSIYTATKSGVEALARTLTMELEGTGIRSTVIRPGPAVSEYANSWGGDRIVKLIGYWNHFGLQRHGGVMPAEAIARAVVLAVTTPAGTHLDTIEIQPEAPRSG